MTETRTEIIHIVSGEGEIGSREVYVGVGTERALRARLTRERCHGDRWARAEVYAYESAQGGHVWIDWETGVHYAGPSPHGWTTSADDDDRPDLGDLEGLLAAIRLDDPRVVDCDGELICDLPTFGGIEPANTTGVWSWDENRLLVGDCADDLEILPRAECPWAVGPDDVISRGDAIRAMQAHLGDEYTITDVERDADGDWHGDIVEVDGDDVVGTICMASHGRTAPQTVWGR